MATSRYDSGSDRSGIDNRVVSTAQGSQNGMQVMTGTNNGTSSTTTDQVQNTNQTTKNMTSAQQSVLDNLLMTLRNGGTASMKANTAARLGQVDFLTQSQGDYTKAAAFGDAQGLISQQMRRTLESLMPSISRAAEDAGSSGGALRALLIQDAANKAAESSSALGVQTASQYGNVNANLSQVIERLTAGGDQAAEALIQALNVAKGSTQTTNGSTSTYGTTTGTTSNNSSSQTGTSSNSNENRNVQTDYAPFAVDTTPKFYGALQPETIDPTKFIGTTLDTLSQLNGTGNPWASYAF